MFYSGEMAERVEHWFNRRYGAGRRDVYLFRTETGWQVVGRLGGVDGQQVTHYFDHEDQARVMLQRMLDVRGDEVQQPVGDDDRALGAVLGRPQFHGPTGAALNLPADEQAAAEEVDIANLKCRRLTET